MTDLLDVELDTVGGDVRTVALLAYPVSSEKKDEPFRLMQDEGSRIFIAQSGLIRGNNVVLSARGASALRSSVINMDGVIQATDLSERGGRILLSGRMVGEDVQIAVRDNGPGLSPEVKASVFERFSARGQPGQRGGAGLGLALVNRFLELHDGWVEIESGEGGAGTLVRCHIPRRMQDAPRPDERDEGGERVAYL